MNRGSRSNLALVNVAQQGFNEAPIHESGKWRPVRPPCQQASSFNEAPIHESGK